MDPANPIQPATSNAAAPLPAKPHKPHKVLKTVFIIAIIAVLGGIAAAAVKVTRDKLEAYRRGANYRAAVKKCGHEPVIVVQSQTTVIEDVTRSAAYSPDDPDYPKYKNQNDDSLGGTEKITGYYCSLEEAGAASAKPDQSNAGLTTDQKAAQAKQILTTYVKDNDVSLYQIGQLSPKLQLDQLQVTKGTKDALGIYQPYQYKYKLVGSQASDSRRVIFKCGETKTYSTPNWVSASAYQNTYYSGFDVTKITSTAKSSYFHPTYFEVNNSGHAWESGMYGTGRQHDSTCGLYDQNNLITKAEGDAMFGSLREIDLSKLTGVELQTL